MTRSVRTTSDVQPVAQSARRGGVRLVVTDRSGEAVTVTIDPREALGLILAAYGEGGGQRR
jgi:hypothetical protein